MRLEHIPLILGVIVGLIGLGFIADAWMDESGKPDAERRRRTRAERSRAGEAIVGVGVLCIAAALMGRDTWRYGTVSVLIGSMLVLIGIVLNRTYLKEALFYRGATRRAEEPSGAGSRESTRPSARAPSRPPAPPSLGPNRAPAPRPTKGPESSSGDPGRGGESTTKDPPPAMGRAAAPSPRPAPTPTVPPAGGSSASPASAPGVDPAAGDPQSGKAAGSLERRKTPRGKRK